MHPKWYSTVEDTKRKIDDPIRKYILNQILNDKDYLKGLSPNAYNGFSAGEINEIVAEVFVKKDYDIHLTQLVKEVLSDDVPK